MYDGTVGSVETEVSFVYIRVIGQSILCLSEFFLFDKLYLSLAWSFFLVAPVIAVGLVKHIFAT